MTQHILLVRHGETEGNLEQIAHGQTESPLNERGQQQAALTAEFLTGWDREYHLVYASPLSRAHHTGEAIADRLGIPLHVHTGLMEGNLGKLEGVTYRELHEFGYAKYSIRDDDFDDHGGESPNRLGDRMAGALAEIRSRHPDENIIIVSHGAAISHLLARLLDTKPAFGHQYLMHNAAITELHFHEPDGTPTLTVLNHYDHLPEELRADPVRSDANAKK